MGLQELLDRKGMSKRRLSRMSGVPKATVMDVCAGRSSIGRCEARTIQSLAHALGCSMEDLMELDAPRAYDPETGLPEDKAYLECGLPPYLEESLTHMKATWERLDAGEACLRWDGDYCCLQSDINNAEVSGAISPEQASYLRETYLRIEKAGDLG